MRYRFFLICFLFSFFVNLSIGRNSDFSKDGPNQIKVALLQLNPEGAHLRENLKKGEQFCRRAKKRGADIVLFPEMWNIGYTRYHWPGSEATPEKYPLSFEAWKNKAVDKNSKFIKRFQNLAKELNLAIVITYLQKWDGHPRNAASLINKNGDITMTYAKVHTSDMKIMESNCTPGEDFYVTDLMVGGLRVNIGLMTCFDREFPESARILMLKGAELVLTPNACGLDDLRIHQFQTRAFENAMGMAMTNYAAPKNNGRSCAFNADGEELLVAGKNEGIYLVTFNIKEIRDYRKNTIWGNAYRRPDEYEILTSPEVDSVFRRKNGLGEPFQGSKR